MAEQKVVISQTGFDGGRGYFWVPGEKRSANVVFSWGDYWDHVSVSYPHKIPNWDEMCYAKNLFFYETETVVQYHPAKSDYINVHQYTLHLWKPQILIVPMPPTYMV